MNVRFDRMGDCFCFREVSRDAMTLLKIMSIAYKLTLEKSCIGFVGRFRA